METWIEVLSRVIDDLLSRAASQPGTARRWIPRPAMGRAFAGMTAEYEHSLVALKRCGGTFSSGTMVCRDRAYPAARMKSAGECLQQAAL